jgi:anaerobic nitric oxide reductase flavorubredoxin
MDEGLRVIWAPDEEGVKSCRDYGKTFARSLLL